MVLFRQSLVSRNGLQSGKNYWKACGTSIVTAVGVTIDRERAGISGVTAEEVSRSLVTATSSSRSGTGGAWTR